MDCKFSKRLKSIRESKGLYQKQVADSILVSQPTYSGYEKGRTLPNAEILLAISEYLNVSADYLIGLSDEFKEVKNVK